MYSQVCAWNFLLTVCWKFELLGSQEMIADVEVMFVAWNKKLNSLSLIDLFSMFANVWWMCCGWEYSLICFWHVSCVWKGRRSICPKNEAKEGLILQLFYGRIAWRHCHMLSKYKTVLQIWEQNKPLIHETKVGNWEEKGCQQKWQCDMRWGPSVRWRVLKSND